LAAAELGVTPTAISHRLNHRAKHPMDLIKAFISWAQAAS
jgi:hypothetical protein